MMEKYMEMRAKQVEDEKEKSRPWMSSQSRTASIFSTHWISHRMKKSRLSESSRSPRTERSSWVPNRRLLFCGSDLKGSNTDLLELEWRRRNRVSQAHEVNGNLLFWCPVFTTCRTC